LTTRRHFIKSVASAALLQGNQGLMAQTSSDPTELSLAAASQLVRLGQLSPLELTQAYLHRIDKYESGINAFITVTADTAMAQAAQLTDELAQGKWRGPLHGIPIALKDNIDTAGIPTTAANAMLANRVPVEDAPVWQKLKAAGAILLGKCNMHEFAYGGTSSISHAGPVHNPWKTDHIPGGSSGGSAAAVAARFCAAALGTDTLASIRLPASYCGVTGLKPTHGLSSIRGIIPVSQSLDHVGPLARSAEDCALVLAAMTGFDPLDPVSIASLHTDYADAFVQPTAALRIGIAQSPYFDRLHPDIAAAMAAALEVLTSLTASVQNVTLPEPSDFTVLLAESYAWHKPWLDNPDNHRYYDSSSIDRILAAGQTPVEDYIRAQQAQRVVRNRITEVFREVDILLTPTAPGLPELISGAMLAQANSAESSVRNTAPFNIYGIPTISLPCGFSSDGLPIGLQLASAHLDETTLFALAHAFQQATQWHLQTPVLA